MGSTGGLRSHLPECLPAHREMPLGWVCISFSVLSYSSIHLYIHPFIHHPSIHLSIHYPSIPPSICTASQPTTSHPSIIHPFTTHPSTHLYIHPSVHLSIHLYLHPSIHPPICTSNHLYIYPSLHPSCMHTYTYALKITRVALGQTLSEEGGSTETEILRGTFVVSISEASMRHMELGQRLTKGSACPY